MPLKGSSGLLIKPCYDGHTLLGVQQVAGDGLSVISIKESHRNCKFLPDPFSKQPLLSCTQGIKARNSFWNLHKPDLRKLKGLECATTESVTQLFRAHNVDNAGKPTYKKKMLRLLESLVSKKTKTPQQPVILGQNRPWPENICVLSSVCEEREIQITGIKIQEKLSSFLEIQQCHVKKENNQMEQNTFVVENYLNTEFDSTKDTVYISLPSPSNMLAHSSDNAYIGTFVQEVDASNGDSTLASFKDTCTNLQSNNTTNLLFTSQTEPSSFKLTSRKSLLHMSVSSCTNCCTKKLIEDIHACSANCNEKNLMNFCEHNVCIEDKAFLNEEKIKDETFYSNNNKRGNTVVVDGNPQYSDQTVAPQSPSSEVVQSIFTEMFKEMQDIEDYISSYISSFCSREEEFENYPAINTMSSEVVSHFFEHVRGSTKPKNDGSKKSSLNTMRILKNNVMSNSVGKSNSDGISLRACSESGCLETEENSYTFGEAGKSSKVSECKDENVYISIPQTSNQTNNETNCSDLGSSYTQDASSGYCYWEDLDITSSNIFGKNKLPQHNLSATEDPSLAYNKALIPASFFENMWKEFIANVDPHDLFIDLVKEEQNPSNLSAPEFSSGYAYWDSVQDRRIWEEAENIVNSIDNFLTIGCFPNFETFRHDNPCSITEITNDNFELIANTKEDNSGISQTVTNLKNPEESCNPVDTQLFSYPQQWSEHTSNQSLYREAELDEENVNSEDCQRRRSIFIQCVSEVSLSEADEHRMSDFGDVTYYEYKVPTCSRNCDIKLHMKKSLDQISEENIPTEIFDQTSSSSDKLKTETVITIEPIEPSADSTTVLSRNSMKLEKSETDTTRDRTVNQGNKNKSAELGKNENQMPSNQSSKNIFKDTKNCVDQVCPSNQQCLYTEISEGYVGSDNKNVSSKVSLNRKISNISTNIALSTFSQLELHNKDPNSGESRFVQIPKASEEISSENTSQMVFSSANVQLNLTNPLHVNKK